MKINRPTLKPCGKDKFKLAEPYEYQGIKVPVGFKTNGANIPRLFWCIFPPNSPEYLSAIVVHDYLCDAQKYRQADDVLRDMMMELGCSKFKIYCFYYACRIYHKAKYKE